LSHSLDPERKPVVVPDVAHDCAGSEAARRKRREGGSQETGGGKESREARQRKREGISDVYPPLSNHSAADHHGKGPGVKSSNTP